MVMPLGPDGQRAGTVRKHHLVRRIPIKTEIKLAKFEEQSLDGRAVGFNHFDLLPASCPDRHAEGSMRYHHSAHASSRTFPDLSKSLRIPEMTESSSGLLIFSPRG